MRSALTVAFAVALSVLAGFAAAQDSPKADTAGASTARQSDTSSDHRKSRAERRAEVAASADAKSQALTEFPKTVTAAPAKQKIECRKQEGTGSRIGKNICATPEQWAEADKQALEAVRQMRSEAGSKAGQAALSGPYTSGGRP